MIGSLRETVSVVLLGLVTFGLPYAIGPSPVSASVHESVSLCLLLLIYKVVGPVERGPPPPAGPCVFMGHAEEHGVGGCVLAYYIHSSQWDIGGGFLVTLPSLYLLCLFASGRLFTAVMPMVAAGLILDDPTLQPVRRLVSLVGTVCVWGLVSFFFSAVPLEWLWWLLPACPS